MSKRPKGVPNKPGDRSQYSKPFKKFISSSKTGPAARESGGSAALSKNANADSNKGLLGVGDSFSQIKLKQEIELNKQLLKPKLSSRQVGKADSSRQVGNVEENAGLPPKPEAKKPTQVKVMYPSKNYAQGLKEGDSNPDLASHKEEALPPPESRGKHSTTSDPDHGYRNREEF